MTDQGNGSSCRFRDYCAGVSMILIVVAAFSLMIGSWIFGPHPMDVRNEAYEDGYYAGWSRACDDLGMENATLCEDPPACNDLACATANGAASTPHPQGAS